MNKELRIFKVKGERAFEGLSFKNHYIKLSKISVKKCEN